MVWIKDYRHLAASHKDLISSKTLKYYKGKLYFLSFFGSVFVHFLHWLVFVLFAQGREKKNTKKSLSQIVQEPLGFFFFFLKGSLIQHFVLYPEVDISYLWKKEFNYNSVEMLAFCLWTTMVYYVSVGSEVLASAEFGFTVLL